MPRLRIASGPQAAEAMLQDWIAERVAEVRADPRLLATPVRVVVPSASLRRHVTALLVRGENAAVAGVEVQTHFAVAAEILRRADEPARGGEALLSLLVRHHARTEPALRRALGAFGDGYSAVEGAVSDLLDAGLDDGGAERLQKLLEEETATAERARAVLRVARNTLDGVRRLAIAVPALTLRRAALLLTDRPALLPSRALLVHGFAEATGAASELLEALVRHGGLLLLDAPPDPGAADGSSSEGARLFVQRLRTRIERIAPAARVRAPPAPCHIRLAEAPGLQAEVRHAAHGIRELIGQGVEPESIGLVSRSASATARAVLTQLSRMEIPFSAVADAVGSSAGPGRRARGLVALFRLGSRAPTDRWLDVVSSLEPGALADLRAGLRRMGAARVGDLASLELAGDASLPSVYGGLEPEGGRRRLDRRQLEAAIAAAERSCHRLGNWPDALPLAAHLRRFRVWLERDLAIDPTSELGSLVEDGLRALDLAPAFEVSRNDFELLLERSFEGSGKSPIGGGGGGVQVLSVMEARARTFEHLFAIGLNRDVFPRIVKEDPLLPDRIRRRMRGELPEMPIKSTGHDEERFLFDELVASSPDVALSWQGSGDDGRAMSPSTLIERLRLSRPNLEVERVPPILASCGPGERTRLHPPHEGALVAALAGRREELPGLLAAAQGEAWELIGARRAARAGACTETRLCCDDVARARLRVVRELDRGPRPGVPLGPYLGFVGAVREARDPRHKKVYVTALEGMGSCSWEHFVRKILRIEPVPDPLAALPSIDARLVGSAVHRVLERIAADALGDRGVSLLEYASREHAVQVAWPGDARVAACLREEARRLLREEGLHVRALEEVLVRLAAPRLERARELDWADPSTPPRVLGVEVTGAVAVPLAGGRERIVAFRADRVDAAPLGLRLTDYKTGRPHSQAARPETRHRHLLAEIGSGERLQAAAYALATGEVEGCGRYLHLDPEERLDLLDVVAHSGDALVGDAFRSATRTLLQARDVGSFTPRLAEHDSGRAPVRCASCDVAEACLRGDSGARGRLLTWLDERKAPPESPVEAALYEVWELAAPRRSERVEART